ncbi:MAG: two-component sensor histidine kinase, partial [Bacteroidetes bacterium]|nr:two-component sensor histidine kinase [Bacteroidota bacterium]
VQQSVYQIALELVNNTVRHAQGTHLTIRLDRTPTELVLDVEDNGIGYQPEKDAPGIGLANIHSRADLYGGSFRVERLPQGMRHVLRIPV